MVDASYDDDFDDDLDDLGEFDPVIYDEPEEQMFYTGFAGLGAARTQKKHVCAAENDDFHWMRLNVCADYQYRRGSAEEIRIRSSRDVAEFFRNSIPFDISTVELMGIIILDAKNVPLGVYEVHRGGIDASIVDPRAVFQPVMMLGGSGVILCHNHPSGNATPSPEDVAITERLVQASTSLGVRLLDHIVLGRDGYFSFLDAGMMEQA